MGLLLCMWPQRALNPSVQWRNMHIYLHSHIYTNKSFTIHMLLRAKASVLCFWNVHSFATCLNLFFVCLLWCEQYSKNSFWTNRVLQVSNYIDCNNLYLKFRGYVLLKIEFFAVCTVLLSCCCNHMKYRSRCWSEGASPSFQNSQGDQLWNISYRVIFTVHLYLKES